MRWFISAFFCLIALGTFTSAMANIDAKTYTLDNGLTLIVVEDNRAPVVVSQVWYKVGSAYETPGISGLSHMLEHMMFKGTKRFPNDTLVKLIAQNGGQQNAATSRDFTYYYQSLPVDKLALSFELEADRMQNLSLKESDFVTENQVVQEERRMRTDDVPQSLLIERFNAAAHLASPYHHPVIGWMHDIQHYTIDDLKHWYHQWYAPNNATLVVVGDVKAKQVYALAKKYFGKLKPNTDLPKLKDQIEPPPLGERHVTVEVPAKIPYVLIGYNVPNFKYAKADWQPYALALAADILAGGDSARFEKDLVRKNQIASEAHADYSAYTLFPGLFFIAAIPSQQQNVTTVTQAIDAQIKQLQTQLVSKAELDKVKNQAIADNVFSQDSMTAKATQIGALASLGLPWQTINSYIDNIKAVTPEQIQAVAREYFTTNRRTVAVLKPLHVTANTN